MPSPLAHMAMGYVIHKMRRQEPLSEADPRRAWTGLSLAIASIAASLLPDLDSVLGLIAGNFGRYHNNATHSLLVGLAVALVVGIIASWAGRQMLVSWFSVTLACYEMHVIMDWLTVGRGVMLFWPFTSSRYSFPFKLFYGLHWSDGWQSPRHFWTLLTELAFVVVIVAAAHLLAKREQKAARSSVQETI